MTGQEPRSLLLLTKGGFRKPLLSVLVPRTPQLRLTVVCKYNSIHELLIKYKIL